jgi:HEAT repeat protein
MHAPETLAVARAKLVDPAWAVRGAAALALGRVGSASDSRDLALLLDDSSGWVRRAATYALGQLKAHDQSPRVRSNLRSPDPEVQLAAIWAMGALEDHDALPELLRLLSVSDPKGGKGGRTLAEGDGAVRLVSDADLRFFDALIQAVVALARARRDPSAIESLRSARARLTNRELDQAARLPTPLGSGQGIVTRRQLFAEVLEDP